MEERWEKRRAGEGKTEREKDDRGDKKERSGQWLKGKRMDNRSKTKSSIQKRWLHV